MQCHSRTSRLKANFYYICKKTDERMEHAVIIQITNGLIKYKKLIHKILL